MFFACQLSVAPSMHIANESTEREKASSDTNISPMISLLSAPRLFIYCVPSSCLFLLLPSLLSSPSFVDVSQMAFCLEKASHLALHMAR